MPILKIVPGEYLNPDALDVLIHRYVFKKAIMIGGLGVDPQYAAEQMMVVKSLFGKNTGKQLHHFVLSFSEEESQRIQDANSLSMLGYSICNYFSEHYQIVFGVHHGRTWHIHFVMNSVSFVDGSRFHQTSWGDQDLAKYISIWRGNKYVPVCYD